MLSYKKLNDYTKPFSPARGTMIFWKIDLLKQRLIDEGLSQRHLFIYIIIYIMSYEIMIETQRLWPTESLDKVRYIDSSVYLIISFLGAFLAYMANGGSKGKQFAERFFSIDLVVSIRFLAISLVIYIFFVIFRLVLAPGAEGESPGPWLEPINELIVIACFSIIWYWRIIVHMKDVANNAPA